MSVTLWRKNSISLKTICLISIWVQMVVEGAIISQSCLVALSLTAKDLWFTGFSYSSNHSVMLHVRICIQDSPLAYSVIVVAHLHVWMVLKLLSECLEHVYRISILLISTRRSNGNEYLTQVYSWYGSRWWPTWQQFLFFCFFLGQSSSTLNQETDQFGLYQTHCKK